MEPLALHMLLEEGVPINRQLITLGMPLHYFMRSPERASLVGSAVVTG
jgi:hypothetical protein